MEYVDKAGLHEELEELIAEVLGRVTTDEARIGLHRAQANLCRGQLKDLRRAADAYLRILEIRPADTEALDQLSILLRDQGEFETLLEILPAQAGPGRDRRPARSHPAAHGRAAGREDARRRRGESPPCTGCSTR